MRGSRTRAATTAALSMIGALVPLGPAGHATDVLYTKTDVSALIPGAVDSEIAAVNDAGVAVGWYEVADHVPHAFAYTHGTVVELAPGLYAVARDINDAGDIVGDTSGGAFVWHAGTLTLLNPVPGSCGWVQAVAINDAGDIAGDSYEACRPFNTQEHAWVLPHGSSTYTVYPANSTAADIADDGTFLYNVTNQPVFPWSENGAVIAKDGESTPLLASPGEIAAAPVDDHLVVAHRMNSHGVVAADVHSSSRDHDYYWAEAWTPLLAARVGTWQPVPTPVPPGNASAQAINDSGVVVGNLNDLPFVSDMSTTQFLNTFSDGIDRGSAYAVTNTGLIGGWVSVGGHHRATVWSAS